jgi:transcriptional regulator with XRE-family HTH domain
MAVGDAMRADRIARGLTIRQEAERLGITPQELSRREQGRDGEVAL